MVCYFGIDTLSNPVQEEHEQPAPLGKKKRVQPVPSWSPFAFSQAPALSAPLPYASAGGASTGLASPLSGRMIQSRM